MQGQPLLLLLPLHACLTLPDLSDAGAPVYFYEFQHRPFCFQDTKPAIVKADPADEVRFVFGGAFLKGDIVMFGHPSSPPVVDTAYGKVLGKFVSMAGFEQPVAVFLGIPFAKPPLGSLRFAPPQPAEPWSLVKNATSYPPMCSQDAVQGQKDADFSTNRKEKIHLTFSEDCLYLNIYTPANLTKRSRLPVMVWIHGGGLTAGGASIYDGRPLSLYGNVVVVTIQYRLGILGFFSTGDEQSKGNWGHLDQVAALRWVQDNIANFGGNPGCVTMFGESAGGESVSVLALSPLTKGLFHRAISESGVAITPALITKDVNLVAKKIANTLGCETTTSAVMVQCLRQKTAEEFLRIPKIVTEPFMSTVIDGVLLPKEPKEILAEKNFSIAPYIVGFNKNEFYWNLPMAGNFFFPILTGTLERILAKIIMVVVFPIIGVPKEMVPEAAEKYFGWTNDPVKIKHRFLDMIGDLLFCVPSVIVARDHRDAGGSTYMYEFEYHPSFTNAWKPKSIKGDHGDEVYSVFGAPILRDGASEEEINLSKMMMKYWTNFAWTGNPNGEGLPHWPIYDQKEGYLQLGATIQAAQGLKVEEVAFWTKNRTKEATCNPPQRELSCL